ncbi:MAG: hypothetical protein IJY27_01905 [Clostridia bacterium]|nr:hypothetical protein [Clostridia bacterium]
MKNKKEFKLLNAVGGVGADLIERAAQPTVRRRPRSLLAVAAVAALLAAMLLTTVAATYDIGFYVSQIFGGDVDMLDSMTAEPGNVSYKSTNKDVKIEVVGITGDRNNAFVWLDVILPEELDVEGKHLIVGDVHAQKRWATFSVDSLSMSHGFLTEKSGNVYSMFCRLSSDNSLVGQRISLSFENICATPEGVIVNPAHYEVLAEGEWKLNFSLNYPDLTEVLEPEIRGEIISIPEDTFTNIPEKVQDVWTNEFVADTCEVCLSPISIRVSIECADNIMTYLPHDIKLILDDGTVLDVRAESGGHSYNANRGRSYFYVSCIFDEPVSPDSVKAIEYCGIMITLK